MKMHSPKENHSSAPIPPRRSTGSKLTSGGIGKILFQMSLPMIWGIFAIVTFNLVDTYFVAQLGTTALAAISFTFPVIMVLNSLALGLANGATSVVARAIGEGNQAKVKRLTTDALILSLIIVAFFALLGILTIDPLFKAIGAQAVHLPLIKDFMEIWYVGMIFLVVPMVGNGAIRASGDTLGPSLIMSVAALINIVLDPIMIFGLYGFPRWELKGASTATVLARAVTLMAAWYYLHYKHKMLEYSFPKFSDLWASWKEILRIGLPSAGANVLTPLSIGFITALLARYGEEVVAAFGIVTKIESFAFIALMGVSASIGPFVGQNWGAKLKERVKTAVLKTCLFAVLWSIFMAVIFAAFATPLIKIFDANPVVLKYGIFYLWVVPFTYAGEGVRMIVSMSYNALGSPMPPVLLIIIKVFLLYIPLALIGGHFFKGQGIFVSLAVANLVVGVIAYRWFIMTLRNGEKNERVDHLP